MNNRYRTAALAFCLFAAGTAFSQTLNQARAWFNEGKFAEAKPVFKKLVKQAPSNASYNFWYGACCFETGEAKESQPYLEKSAARKVINAYLYLGRLYYTQYRFDDAVENLEEHIGWLEKKKTDTTKAEKELEKARMAARMLRATENVAVIDSFTVDKADFLSAYKLSKESGSISMEDSGNGARFTNELEDKTIFAQQGDDGKTYLYSRIKLIDKWSDRELVRGISESGENFNFPFLDSDGITLYYSAQGEESLGGYDIFITRYDSEDNTYLRPDNIGMPFNSIYNDYMYAIDDLNNLGWFASDRYQPEGKVCVYVFSPNESKSVYDYESTDPDKIIAAATLKSIKTTWNDADKVRIAKQQLARAMYGSNEQKKKTDFNFIIDDNAVYTVLSDFRSKEARELFQSLRQKENDLSALSDELSALRTSYLKANEAEKSRLAPGISDKESRVSDLRREIEQLTWAVRNTEIAARR